MLSSIVTSFVVLFTLSYSSANSVKHLLAPAQVADTEVTDTVFPQVTLTPAAGELLPQMIAEIKKARAMGRTPVVDISASWCLPCWTVKRALQGKEMRETMKGMYVINVDLDDWKPALAALGFEFEGLPRVAAIDTTGHPSGEPWRPRDIPEDLQQLGVEESFEKSLAIYFEAARIRFPGNARSKKSATAKGP